MLRVLTSRPTVAAFLAIASTVGFFSLIYMIVYVPVPVESRDILQVMIGVVGTSWTTIVGYFYGSSAHQEARAEGVITLASPDEGNVKTTQTVKTEAVKTVTSEQPPPKKENKL